MARKHKGPIRPLGKGEYSLHLELSDKEALIGLLDQLRDSLMNGSTFVVHIQHQRSCFFKAVAKKFLQYESDIRHQIDGVIPNEHNPGAIRVNRTIDVRFFDGCRSNFRIVHTSSVP